MKHIVIGSTLLVASSALMANSVNTTELSNPTPAPTAASNPSYPSYSAPTAANNAPVYYPNYPTSTNNMMGMPNMNMPMQGNHANNGMQMPMNMNMPSMSMPNTNMKMPNMNNMNMGNMKNMSVPRLSTPDGTGWKMPNMNMGNNGNRSGWNMPMMGNGSGWKMPTMGNNNAPLTLPTMPNIQQQGSGWNMPTMSDKGWRMPNMHLNDNMPFMNNGSNVARPNNATMQQHQKVPVIQANTNWQKNSFYHQDEKQKKAPALTPNKEQTSAKVDTAPIISIATPTPEVKAAAIKPVDSADTKTSDTQSSAPVISIVTPDVKVPEKTEKAPITPEIKALTDTPEK